MQYSFSGKEALVTSASFMTGSTLVIDGGYTAD